MFVEVVLDFNAWFIKEDGVDNYTGKYHVLIMVSATSAHGICSISAPPPPSASRAIWCARSRKCDTGELTMRASPSGNFVYGIRNSRWVDGCEHFLFRGKDRHAGGWLPALPLLLVLQHLRVVPAPPLLIQSHHLDARHRALACHVCRCVHDIQGFDGALRPERVQQDCRAADINGVRRSTGRNR